ncbi:arfaptin-1 isoform X2 [Paramisgurnus dabryanus]|uniref:arfaptin-1 isoform X2 n=1 Tax=Paramisgurnus dabryanus TaxID=90735 RepID=UPI0031F37295
MSEASFDSEKNASQDKQSDPTEQGPQNTDDSLRQSESSKNNLDETNMTEIDISENKEVENHNHAMNNDGNEDKNEDSHAQIKTSEVLKDRKENADIKTTTNVTSMMTEADVKVAMAEEANRSPAAQISVTRNGESDRGHEDVFHRDVPHTIPGPDTSHSNNSPENYAVTEGVVQMRPHPGAFGEQQAGAVVLSDDMKSPAMEKLELVRKWSINTYKCTKQILSEKLGRGSRTVDLELEAQIEVLRDNKRKYEHVVKLAQTLVTQLGQMMLTQRQLGDAFADLSLKTPELHEEFGYNAETQKLLSKNGETLLGAINFFIASVKTLVDKTIEDTLINIKQYEAARIEYDAYRTDLEELNLGPRDANTLPKIELSQQQFQIHREKYEKMRTDVSVKLKFLEENKVKVLHNQLILFHNAIAAYFAGNQQQLDQTLKQFHIKLKLPGGDIPSWLESSTD